MINSLNIFNSNPRNIISFKQIPFVKKNDIKYSEEYKCLSKDYFDYFVRSNSDFYDNNLVTVIDEEDCFNIAHNDVEIQKEQKVLFTQNMNVFSDRKRGNGLGVILHLNNIMNLLENDLDRIELYSIGSAVLFHGKCKFEPQICDTIAMRSAIFTVAMVDSDKYPQLKNSVKKANDFLKEIDVPNRECSDYDAFMAKGNKIINEYIEAVSKLKLDEDEKRDYGFILGFGMVLTKERILENKDFYNKLFKKYHIDYEIKDPQ